MKDGKFIKYVTNVVEASRRGLRRGVAPALRQRLKRNSVLGLMSEMDMHAVLVMMYSVGAAETPRM